MAKGKSKSDGDDKIVEACMGAGAAVGSLGGPVGIAVGTGVGWVVGALIKGEKK